MGATTSPFQEQGDRRGLRKILFTFGFVAIDYKRAEPNILHFEKKKTVHLLYVLYVVFIYMVFARNEVWLNAFTIYSSSVLYWGTYRHDPLNRIHFKERNLLELYFKIHFLRCNKHSSLVLKTNKLKYCQDILTVSFWNTYRVIQEESAILWEMIVCVILSKKVHMNLGPILNGYRDMVKRRYGSSCEHEQQLRNK